MQDRDLQISGRMLVESALPFRGEYLRLLRDVHTSQAKVAAWQALRAMSEWTKPCQELVATTLSWKVLSRFGLRTSEGSVESRGSAA
jgi:hypothetical protein